MRPFRVSGNSAPFGSGVTVSNGAAYLEFADGVIVGTSVKHKVFNPVDSNRVAALRKAIQ
jgi:predicted TIM-barrel enzyme